MKHNKIIIDMSRLLAFAAVSLFVLGFVSCGNDDSDDDKTPPGKLTVTNVVPTYGGAKIAYILPSDEDILFVKAQYTTTLGKKVFKSSSYYNDTIEVDGFDDVNPQTIELYVVDRNNNHSEVVETEVTPLKSYIHLVQESILVEGGFGGVTVSWENIEEKSVHVKLIIDSEKYGTDSIIISSNYRTYKTTFRGLDSVYYTFNSKVKDNHENTTNKEFIATVKPKFEEKIDKDSWTLVKDLSVDGNAYEGLTENFWDGVIDDYTNPDDNSYFIIHRDNNGQSLNFPLDIVIDFNKQVIVNRFQLWQRAYWWKVENNGTNVSEEPYYYQSENVKEFDFYTSNDKIEWTLAGQFDIDDPKDDNGNISDEAIQEAIDGHIFILDETTEPFRYLKFAIKSGFGSETQISLSEITLYGLDNVVE